MASKSKAKGNRFEKECVDIAESHGFNAKRAWGSDGRSLGESPEVDLIIDYLLDQETSRKMKVQCKVRKSIASYLLHLTIVILRLSNKIEAKYMQPFDIEICWS